MHYKVSHPERYELFKADRLKLVQSTIKDPPQLWELLVPQQFLGDPWKNIIYDIHNFLAMEIQKVVKR